MVSGACYSAYNGTVPESCTGILACWHAGTVHAVRYGSWRDRETIARSRASPMVRSM